MTNIFIEILNFLQQNFRFLYSLIIFCILAIVLRKSIKKHAKIYYWIFGIFSSMAFVPVLGYWTGLYKFSFYSIPILGDIVREFSSMVYMGHPLLVIIMYMGALSTKNKKVAGLMSIRKELSILVGFPVIAHALKRIMTGVWALGYFIDHDEFMEKSRFTDEVATAIYTSVLVLGFLMFALFLVLWITSFDGVRKKMTYKKWKAIQRWSYGLYAMLFLQAVGLQLGPFVNALAEESQKARSEQVVEVNKSDNHEDTSGLQEKQDTIAHVKDSVQYSKNVEATTATHSNTSQQKVKTDNQKKEGKGHGNRRKRFVLSEIKLSYKTLVILKMIIFLGVYGSYLVLRLRKAKKDKQRKRKNN